MNCKTCGKYFKHLTNLSRHAKLHKEFSVKCGTCGKTFSRADNLKRHQFSCGLPSDGDELSNSEKSQQIAMLKSKDKDQESESSNDKHQQSDQESESSNDKHQQSDTESEKKSSHSESSLQMISRNEGIKKKKNTLKFQRKLKLKKLRTHIRNQKFILPAINSQPYIGGSLRTLSRNVGIFSQLMGE